MSASRVATGVLLGAGALLLSLAFRAGRLLVELRQHGADASALRDVGLLTGCLGLAGALIVTACRLPPARRANLALASASVGLSLYLFEGWHAADDRIARQIAEKIELIEAFRRTDPRAYGGAEPVHFTRWRENGGPPSLTVAGADLLPLAGISRRLTVDCREGEEAPWRVYVADEHGFSNPPGLWGAAPVELAALGDSFTAGSCVSPAASMLGRLRARYLSSLNLGMPGNGPLLMLATLREFLAQARPRLVLWCHFGGNDLRDLRREREHPVLKRYLEDDFQQGLPAKQAAIDAALEAYYDSWLAPAMTATARHQIRLGSLLTLRMLRSRLGLTFPNVEAFVPSEEEFRLFETILRTAQVTTARWGGRLYFVYLPGWSASPPPLQLQTVGRFELGTRRRVLSIAASLGLPVVDLEPVFAPQADGTSLFACPGCHYSAAGYRLAADALLAGLEAQAPAQPGAGTPAPGPDR